MRSALGLVLLVVLVREAPWPTPAQVAAVDCGRWIRVGEVALCGRPVALAAWCAGLRSARVGDTARLSPRGWGCVAELERTPARVVLALGGRLDVNSASAAALRLVPSIGPKRARAIVRARPFARIEGLERVRGIGAISRRRLARRLRVGPPPRLWPSSTPPGAPARGTP